MSVENQPEPSNGVAEGNMTADAYIIKAPVQQELDLEPKDEPDQHSET